MAIGKCDVFKRLGYDASRREFGYAQKGNSSFNRCKVSRCHDYKLNRKNGLVSSFDGPSWVSKEHEGLQMPPNEKRKYSFNRSKVSRCGYALNCKNELVSPLDGPGWVSKEHEGLQMPPNKKQKYSTIEDVRPSSKKTAAPCKSPLKSSSSSLTDEDLGELASKKSVFLNWVDRSEILSINSDEVVGKSTLELSTKRPSPLPQKQFVEYEQESGMVEDIQERSIWTSRWALESDLPSYPYASDDEEIDRNRRKSDSRNSGCESGELLTGSTSQVVGSVEKDNILGMSGKDCIDDPEDGNCDAMDVERCCTSDTADDCNDMADGDDDVFHDAEEHAGLPRRSVNMLFSCRSVFEYEKLNKINEGVYGVVYRARDKTTGEIVALKKVKMNVGDREGFPISSLREIDILLSFDHPSLVGFREVVMDDNDLDSVFIVMEYMEHDLKSLMERSRRPFSISEVKCLMIQLLEGVKYLHDNCILHRDLKTSNILFNNKGELKICDFGLSRRNGSPLEPYTPLVVTLWYRAPELLLGAKEYSPAIDMWSVGCIMAELLCNEPLFNGSNEVNQLDKIFRTLGTPNKKMWPGFSELPGAKANFVNQPLNLLRKKFSVSPFIGSMYLSGSGYDLLNRLLTYDPQKRITAVEALNHEWFREVPLPSFGELSPLSMQWVDS